MRRFCVVVDRMQQNTFKSDLQMVFVSIFKFSSKFGLNLLQLDIIFEIFFFWPFLSFGPNQNVDLLYFWRVAAIYFENSVGGYNLQSLPTHFIRIFVWLVVVDVYYKKCVIIKCFALWRGIAGQLIISKLIVTHHIYFGMSFGSLEYLIPHCKSQFIFSFLLLNSNAYVNKCLEQSIIFKSQIFANEMPIFLSQIETS